MDKYTVAEFCKKYNDAKSNEVKELLIKGIMNIDYVPYEQKIVICEQIIDRTYYIKDENDIKKFHVYSPGRYMLYCLWLIKKYTNIEIDFNNSLSEFNLLNKYRVLDVIISKIPEIEVKEFRMILDMVENDVITNEYENHAFISNQVERFGKLIGFTLTPLLEKINYTLENMDEETINKMIIKLDAAKGLNILNGLVKKNK